MKIAEFEGPGQMVTAHSDVNGVQVELNSEDPTSSVTYPSRAHDHQAFLFSAPGVYRVVFAYSGVGGRRHCVYGAVGDLLLCWERRH